MRYRANSVPAWGMTSYVEWWSLAVVDWRSSGEQRRFRGWILLSL